MDAKELLRQEISDLEDKLKARRKALREIENADGQTGPSGRFTGKRPLAAMLSLLAENGGRMREDDLTKALIEGGLTAGRKRAHHNIRVSYDISAKAGSIVRKDGWVSAPNDKR